MGPFSRLNWNTPRLAQLGDFADFVTWLTDFGSAPLNLRRPNFDDSEDALVSNAVAEVTMFLVAIAVGNSAIAGKQFDLSDVQGRYAFTFDGEITDVGPVAASGYLVADGNGNIFEAKRTISTALGAVTETFTCVVAVDADGMGSAECPLDEPQPDAPSVEGFDFVIARDRQSFRFVGTTQGFVVTGTGHR